MYIFIGFVPGSAYLSALLFPFLFFLPRLHNDFSMSFFSVWLVCFLHIVLQKKKQFESAPLLLSNAHCPCFVLFLLLKNMQEIENLMIDGHCYSSAIPDFLLFVSEVPSCVKFDTQKYRFESNIFCHSIRILPANNKSNQTQILN